LWIVLAVAVTGIAKTLDAELQDNYSLPGTQAQQATDDLNTYFPQAAGKSATVVFVSDDGPITAQADQQYVGIVLKQLFALDGVAAVSNPYTVVNSATPNISQDQTTALVTVNYSTDVDPTADLTDPMTALIGSSAAQASSLNITVTPGGNTYFTSANSGTDDYSSEVIGIVAAIIILLIAFGSVVAMGLPLVSAILGLGIGLSSTLIVANWLEISTIGPTIATMLGLGVGIDYSLFIVSRYREYLREGHSVPESVGRAVGTAGQAVIVAGLTVIIALMGLLLIQIPIITSIAYAAAIAVAAAIFTSVTLLPIILGIFGRQIEKLNVHHLFGHDGTNTKTAQGWGRTITEHPRKWMAVALIIFAMLIIPIFSMELGAPGENTVPEDNPYRTTYSVISEKFGVGYNGPLLVVSTLPTDESSQNNVANLKKIQMAAASSPGVEAVNPATINADGTAAIWAIIATTSPSSAETETTINTLVDSTIPGATASSGISTNIGGQTATFVDMAEKITSKMPIFMASVVGMAFILLLVVFRSVFVPILAALMILLTASATFGVMVAVFQWGWFDYIIGLNDATGPLISYVPIMVFAIIFGMSMDYMIFLVSRIKERQMETGNNKEAIVFGISKSARVIIAAALIMISVFASFNTQANLVIKMFGTGLAVAILVDVVLARMILVPAIMTLGGKKTWAFPKWLHWIPDLKFEDSSVFDRTVKKPKKATKRK